jgi:hypothetical protein
MAMRVGGWEKAKAALSWGGYGLRQCFWQHHPPRKRADFPAVSRHENHGGIGAEGVANVGGFVPLVLPSPEGNRPTSSIVQPACCANADGSVTVQVVTTGIMPQFATFERLWEGETEPHHQAGPRYTPR